jgi:thymidine kinase
MSNVGTMSSHSKAGYLEIILGGMYAGKTSRLVEIYKKCNFCNISVVVINHSIDNRYDNSLMTTHDKIKIPCIKTENLFDIWNTFEPNFMETIDLSKARMEDKIKIYHSQVILINEGQFFPDLFDFIIELLKHDKQIYVCGLDGDFERKKFGQILDLIPLCDRVTKLTSLCSICKNGTPGIFSKRITSETTQTVVGSDNYIPVCRICYNK